MSTNEKDIISRVRRELGDLMEPFRETYRGTGEQDEFDLPVVRIALPTMRVFTIDPQTSATTTLSLGSDYTVSSDSGVVRLTSGPLAANVLLVAEGQAYGMFTDEELGEFVHDALLMHTNERVESTRYRDADGFIKYEKVKQGVDNLREVEHLPVSILATVEALWALSTDAATDIDINTAEGTFVPRSQRYRQIVEQIDLLTDKYRDLCMLLGIGLYGIETTNLRRVSRTTGRYVPLYVDREFDDHSAPIRILPAINNKDADPDGPSSTGDRGLF